MCLAIPGLILSRDETAGYPLARVRFGGVVRETRLDFVPEAEIGDYVLVHVGFALSRLDPEEAERTFAALREAGLLEPDSEDGGPSPDQGD
jgi:hydrogenase expression/formation protein HypC